MPSIHARFQGLPTSVRDKAVYAAGRRVTLSHMLAATQMRAAILHDIYEHFRN